MTEVRYIKIKSCKECGFCGHKSNANRKNTIFFCSNPENMKIEQLPAEMIGDHIYPIISVTTKDIATIPYWCKLPSEAK